MSLPCLSNKKPVKIEEMPIKATQINRIKNLILDCFVFPIEILLLLNFHVLQKNKIPLIVGVYLFYKLYFNFSHPDFTVGIGITPIHAI